MEATTHTRTTPRAPTQGDSRANTVTALPRCPGISSEKEPPAGFVTHGRRSSLGETSDCRAVSEAALRWGTPKLLAALCCDGVGVSMQRIPVAACSHQAAGTAA